MRDQRAIEAAGKLLEPREGVRAVDDTGVWISPTRGCAPSRPRAPPSSAGHEQSASRTTMCSWRPNADSIRRCFRPSCRSCSAGGGRRFLGAPAARAAPGMPLFGDEDVRVGRVAQDEHSNAVALRRSPRPTRGSPARARGAIRVLVVGREQERGARRRAPATARPRRWRARPCVAWPQRNQTRRAVLTNDSAIQANRMTNSARMTVSSPVSPPTASTRYISSGGEQR